MKYLPPSELILDQDGSIYHLNLHPEDIADTIITVGDPERVKKVSRFFDRIELKKQKREFVTHTGWFEGKRLTVISTGIGTDNIDIVVQELDALVNIDLKKRQEKEEKKSLDIIRIGTSGCLQADISVDSFVASAYGIGFDNLMQFYAYQPGEIVQNLTTALSAFMYEEHFPTIPIYGAQADQGLLNQIGFDFHKGITITSSGFYGPQGRSLRLKSLLSSENLDNLGKFRFRECPITNFEMETAGIYSLASQLGHNALSCNLILANRMNNTFSTQPKKFMHQLIKTVLERIALG